MSVIKTLDASENNDEREKEKLKIEKEFKKSDKRLQELVTRHDSDLTKVKFKIQINLKFMIYF
jgi:exocyst complex component 4